MYNLGQHFINQPQNLISNPETIFVGSKYRITVLTERLIRLEYSDIGKFSDDATQLVINRNFEKPNFEAKQDNLYLEIKTDYFNLNYSKNKPFKGSGMNSMQNLRIQVNGMDSINLNS